MAFSKLEQRHRLAVLIALLGALVCLPTSSTSAQGRCSAARNNRAVSMLVNARKSWSSLLKHQKAFAICDDGELGEGYSDAVVHLFARQWDQFGAFAAIARKDPGFERWAVRHVDATASNEELHKIIVNTNSCADHSNVINLCRVVQQSAKNALIELEKTQNHAGQ